MTSGLSGTVLALLLVSNIAGHRLAQPPYSRAVHDDEKHQTDAVSKLLRASAALRSAEKHRDSDDDESSSPHKPTKSPHSRQATTSPAPARTHSAASKDQASSTPKQVIDVFRALASHSASSSKVKATASTDSASSDRAAAEHKASASVRPELRTASSSARHEAKKASTTVAPTPVVAMKVEKASTTVAPTPVVAKKVDTHHDSVSKAIKISPVKEKAATPVKESAPVKPVNATKMVTSAPVVPKLAAKNVTAKPTGPTPPAGGNVFGVDNSSDPRKAWPCLEVHDSNIKAAGQGLFAKCPLKNSTLLGEYRGDRFLMGEHGVNKRIAADWNYIWKVPRCKAPLTKPVVIVRADKVQYHNCSGDNGFVYVDAKELTNISTNPLRYVNAVKWEGEKRIGDTNVEAFFEDDRVWYHTLKDISPGEELIIDYGASYWKLFLLSQPGKVVERFASFA